MKNPMTREEMINSTNFDRATNTFTITKKLYNASCKYGSEAYDFIEELKTKHPDCKIEVRKTAKRDSYNGLNYKFMEEYINRNTKEDSNIRIEFQILRKDKANFLEVKKWFFEKFPEVKEFGTKTASNKILNKKVCKMETSEQKVKTSSNTNPIATMPLQ